MTRTELFASLVCCVFGFPFGELLYSLVFDHAPDWRSVYHAAWGALIFALVLAFTRGEA
jgi:hypothetical protein